VIDGLNALFMQAVSTGRRLTMEQTTKLFDGRIHVASEALSLGLIDGVQSLDQSLAEVNAVSMATRNQADNNKRRLDLARARGR